MTDSDKQLPASWGGFDLAAAQDAPCGAFANEVRLTSDPLWGWPAIPDEIAADLGALKRESPAATRFEHYLADRIAAVRLGQRRHPQDDNVLTDPCPPHWARRILADFAQRCRDESQGLRRGVSDWSAWAERGVYL